MYNVGDYIIYGSTGVCRVERVGDVVGMDMPKDTDYYTLMPVYSKASSIFTPVDNTRIIMRPVMDHDEAISLLDRIKDIEIMIIKDERKRELDYKSAISTCDPEDLVKIIKTIYQRKTERIACGKKATASDDKYFHLAEDSLYGELAISLGMDKDEVQKFIEDRMAS